MEVTVKLAIYNPTANGLPLYELMIFFFFVEKNKYMYLQIHRFDFFHSDKTPLNLIFINIHLQMNILRQKMIKVSVMERCVYHGGTTECYSRNIWKA